MAESRAEGNGDMRAGHLKESNAEKRAEDNAKKKTGNGPKSSAESRTDMIEEENDVDSSEKRAESGEHSLAAGSSDVAVNGSGEYDGAGDDGDGGDDEGGGDDGGGGDGGRAVDYTDPVFKKLAILNGEINRMTKDQLRRRLGELHLNTRGVKEVLKKRLKNYYRRRKLMSANMARGIETVRWDFLVVIDFEATCQENNDHFTHEIIEFPAALIDVKSRTVVAKFREFCRPVLNPVLSEFCKTLTGITQKDVDSAQQFKDVLHSFDQWLLSKGLGDQHSFCVVTDGPWDMQRFLSMQCQVSGLPLPLWCRRWVNMRKAFTALYDTGRVNIQRMLQHLGLGFEGRPHCGMDDTLNIARIVCNMLQDGSPMKANERLAFDPQDFVKPAQADTSSDPDSGSDHHDNPEAGSCSHYSEGGDSKGARSQCGVNGVSSNSKPQSASKKKQAEREQEAESEEDVSDLLYYFKLQSS